MDTILKIKYPAMMRWHYAKPALKFHSGIKFATLFIMNTNTDTDKTGFEQELAQHIITALNLDIALAEIDPLAPLYGDDGLGIDSIDVLEISLVLSKQYGVQLRSDDEKNAQIFASLRSLANHIQQNRTK
jgi:acyl carrier protein